MEKRKLGNTELEVSVIGFGGWGIGGEPFWQSEGDEVSRNSIHRAHEMGINFFDTAPVYGFGRSEKLIGQILKPYREKIILATKFGLRWDKENVSAIRRDCSKASIKTEVDLSLLRLETDYIDLYQVHWPDEKTSHEETMEALLEIQEEGKIRYFGVSNYSISQIEACSKLGKIVSIQNSYNLLQRDLEKEILPFCRQKKLGVLAYSPLASGVLCGKYDKNTKFMDWRSRNILGEFTGEGFIKNLKKVEVLKKLSNSLNMDCTQLAINWVVSQPGVSSALVGVKKPSQVEHNVSSIGWSLSAEMLEELEKTFSREES